MDQNPEHVRAKPEVKTPQARTSVFDQLSERQKRALRNVVRAAYELSEREDHAEQPDGKVT